MERNTAELVEEGMTAPSLFTARRETSLIVPIARLKFPTLYNITKTSRDFEVLSS
jgi:hypothetical protein